MSKKKINCKHGLTYKQEIEARRMKDIFTNPEKISERDEIILKSMMKFRKQIGKNGIYETFFTYLKREDPVLLSAIKRSKVVVSEII